MANKTITMLQLRRILQLKQQSKSNRQISREVGLSRDSVNHYIRRIEKTGLSLGALFSMDDEQLSRTILGLPQTIKRDWRYDDLQQRLQGLGQELKRSRVTRQVLWEEYLAQVPEGYSYSQFCEHFSRYLQTKQAVMHFEHKPAAGMMIDFAGDYLSYTDPDSGEIIPCPVLACILPFSGYTYVEALRTARRDYLLKGLNNCLYFFDGVPLSAISDNMRQIVKKSNRYEPAFTDLALQWSVHYDTTLMATRVRSPRDKASVESAINAVYNFIYARLRHCVFHSLEELNKAIMEQLILFNQRCFQGRDYSRYDKFMQEEKPLLMPLPLTAFVPKYKASAKVQRNYHITLGEDSHHYSIPYQYIGKKVEVIYDIDDVEVYYQQQRIANHKRDFRKHQYTTVDEHMPTSHQYYNQIKGYDREYFLEQSQKIGGNTVKAIERILEQKIFIQQTYNSCLGVLRLTDRYGHQRLEAACCRAIQGYKVTYKAIRNILESNLDKDVGQTELPLQIPTHENIRGHQSYQ
jgi:transposase